jgi:hypothetical protein
MLSKFQNKVLLLELLGNTGAVDFVHCPEVETTRKHNVLEKLIYSLSSGDGKETPYSVGSLRKSFTSAAEAVLLPERHVKTLTSSQNIQ